MDSSKTLSGAQLLTCQQDAACPSLDCDALMNEYSLTLKSVPGADEYVAHFCGLGYVDKLLTEHTPANPEKSA
ncbi:MAG: hypothetical protein B7Y41_10160 [Hydrogenophilales bacterium 28-61-23]|nr:MAG: hypothetical protein B7Y41_10160 [Hydrogenophilales bacterium 28-61-23]